MLFFFCLGRINDVMVGGQGCDDCHMIKTSQVNVIKNLGNGVRNYGHPSEEDRSYSLH